MRRLSLVGKFSFSNITTARQRYEPIRMIREEQQYVSLAPTEYYDELLVRVLAHSHNSYTRDRIVIAFKLSNLIKLMHAQLLRQQRPQESYVHHLATKNKLQDMGYKISILPSQNLVQLERDFRVGRSSLFHSVISFGGTKLDKRNNPIQRNSLYFNELKDFDKMIQVNKIKGGAPHYFNQILRENIQASLLDQDNPLGFPETCPFKFGIELNHLKKGLDWKAEYSYHLRTIKLTSVSAVVKEARQWSPQYYYGTPRGRDYSPNVKDIPPELQNGINTMVRERVINGEAIQECLNLSYFLYWMRKLYRYEELHEFLCDSILNEQEIVREFV